MENPFEKLSAELQEIKETQLRILKALEDKPTQLRVPIPEYMRIKNITRPTVYAWADRGLIKLEKIGSRQFVISSNLDNISKHQRART